MKKEQLTDSCFMFTTDDGNKYSIVQPAGMDTWVLIDIKGALLFGPDSFAKCEQRLYSMFVKGENK